MRQRGVCDGEVLFAIADAPVVFAPRHLASVGSKIPPANVVVDAPLGPAHAGEVAFGLIGAGLTV